MKNNRKYYFILFLLFAVVVVIQYNAPKPIDWIENYLGKSKTPNGCYIINDLLPDLFPKQQISTSKIPIYNTIKNQKNTNYIIINNKFNPDELDTKTLFNYVKQGNYLFVAARLFEGPFSDSLKLKTEGDFFLEVSENQSQQEVNINFEHHILHQPQGYQMSKRFYNYYFTNFDSTYATILGNTTINRTIKLGKTSVLSLNAKAPIEHNANFIKIKMGKGYIFINTLPNTFTNYFLTDTLNYSYPIKALSYLPNRTTIWDEYYKAGKRDASTPLRFILNQPALKFAYFLLIFGLLFYILFKTKRKQRIIPVIEPLTNSTTDFIGVISSMYYQENNHLDLAKKKIAYFLENSRTNYLLSTENLDAEFIKKLALKSGASIETTTFLIDKINAIKPLNGNFTASDLASLNQALTKFNQQKN